MAAFHCSIIIYCIMIITFKSNCMAIDVYGCIMSVESVCIWRGDGG